MTRRRRVIGRRMGGRSEPPPDLELVSVATAEQCQLLPAGETTRGGGPSPNYISSPRRPSTEQSAPSRVSSTAANRTNYWCLIIFTERLACAWPRRARRLSAGVGTPGAGSQCVGFLGWRTVSCGAVQDGSAVRRRSRRGLSEDGGVY